MVTYSTFLSLTFGRIKKTGKNQKFTEEELGYIIFTRFADDMVVTARSSKVLQIALTHIQEFIKIRGLETKESKTRIIPLPKGFTFDFFS